MELEIVLRFVCLISNMIFFLHFIVVVFFAFAFFAFMSDSWTHSIPIHLRSVQSISRVIYYGLSWFRLVSSILFPCSLWLRFFRGFYKPRLLPGRSHARLRVACCSLQMNLEVSDVSGTRSRTNVCAITNDDKRRYEKHEAAAIWDWR